MHNILWLIRGFSITAVAYVTGQVVIDVEIFLWVTWISTGISSSSMFDKGIRIRFKIPGISKNFSLSFGFSFVFRVFFSLKTRSENRKIIYLKNCS